MMKSVRGVVLVWFVSVLVAALVVGCGGGSGGDTQAPDGPATPTGRVAILLTDAPSDEFDEINVTVKQVYLLGDGERTLLVEFPGDGRPYNLLNLRDSAELLMDPAVVEAGCYEKIRLVVSAVELVRYRRDDTGAIVEGRDGKPMPGEGFPVYPKLPGNGKIDLNPRGEFCVVPGETLVVQLDMDANNCIQVVEKKHGKEFNFRPVVFVTVLDGAADVLGKLVRLNGWVTKVGEDSFLLCDTQVEPLARPAYDSSCTEVVLADDTGLFDLDGLPVQRTVQEPLDTVVFEGDFLRVVGRYTVVARSDRAAADPDGVCDEKMGPCDDWDDDDLMLRRFLAGLVEVGVSPQTWGRYAGEILPGGGVRDSCEGTFQFRLDEGQGISRQLDIAVHLFSSSRVYDRNGDLLNCTDLQVGTRAVVDAVISLSDDAVPVDVLNAALVVTRLEPETRIDGTLTRVADGGRVFGVVPEGAPDDEVVCVELIPRGVVWLYTPGMGNDESTFEVITLGQEHLNSEISVSGEWVQGRECFSAGGAFVTAPMPSSDT